MSAPLYEKLLAYQKLSPYPFHMPGHKQNPSFLPAGIPAFDITEIEGFDNLHHAEGIISQAQGLCAEMFGAEESFFLVNGSTSGLEAAVLTVCREGEQVLVARNCHRAVYSGLFLSGAKPVFVYPEWDEKTELSGGISPEAVQEAVKKYPYAKAFILTSPTYEGFVSDICKIGNIVHTAGMSLIVDEAHGAHFCFSSIFPKPALACGADIVVQSVHKTLPALTQCALLHVQGTRADRDRLKEMLAVVMTSSPSYLLMGAIDAMQKLLAEKKETLFVQYSERLMGVYQALSNLRMFSLLDNTIIGRASVYDRDIGKLVFSIPHKNCTGTFLKKRLRQKYQLEMEMAGPYSVLAMTSIADTDSGFQRLITAMTELDKQVLPAKEKGGVPACWITASPKQVLSIRQAMMAEKKFLPLKEAEGCISGAFFIPYPPGIPLLVPGERLGAVELAVLKKLLSLEIPVLGIKGEKNYISVLKME